MTKLKKLTRANLHQLLGFYEQVRIEQIGGYDTGVYFYFSGIRKADLPNIIEGRYLSSHGFCSESVCISRKQLLQRDGLVQFWKRVEKRQAQLEKWFNEFCGEAK